MLLGVVVGFVVDALDFPLQGGLGVDRHGVALWWSRCKPTRLSARPVGIEHQRLGPRVTRPGGRPNLRAWQCSRKSGNSDRCYIQADRTSLGPAACERRC